MLLKLKMPQLGRNDQGDAANWAKDSSTLSVSRPMLELVLNDWVTDTNETP